MIAGQKINCYCHECQREWAMELVATLAKDKRKSIMVHCPFCGGGQMTTTDKQKGAKNPWREHSQKEINKMQADSLEAFRDKLGSSSNVEALDKIDNIKRGLQAALDDHAKYPQLTLPDMQHDRIEGLLREFDDVPF